MILGQKRVSYLAKVETKHYGDRSRNFGYSRTKKKEGRTSPFFY
ncbi:inovirus Gp2 family protein [Vibrio splendidus]|nr:inovirus-type Gp2 protein [Vibrio splendidus]UOE89798.1 inovirus Gp2 family protein [Vibrio splendidus]